jgi:hypothetical protein
VRREQREEPELGEHVVFRLQTGVDEHTGPMGVGDDLLEDAIAPQGIDVGDAIAQRVGGQVLVGIVQMALVVEEGGPVADEILQIAYWRPIDGRVVDPSFKMPLETVNQTRLTAEYAVPTPSLSLRVQRGSIAGAPGAGCSCSKIAMDQDSWPRRLRRPLDGAGAPASLCSLRRADPLCMATWSVLSLSIRYCGSSLEA